jgi:hypothetical protein
MKKIVLSIVCLSIVSFMFYCTKTDEKIQPKQPSVQQGQAGVSEKVAMKVVSNPDNSGCPCGAGMATCTADCLFSDCCTCWDPKKETGACGCYFGIAKCMTELTTQPSTSPASSSVKLYNLKFADHLRFLSSIGGDTRELQQIVSTINLKGKKGKDARKGDYVEADALSYQKFYDAYKTCIESFDLKAKAVIQGRLAVLQNN